MAKAKTASGKKKPLTKTQFVQYLAEKSELKKSDVVKMLDALVYAVHDQLGPKGPGKLVIPGLARLYITEVKAVKGGEKKINPLNGQEYITKPRPAHNKVNMKPIKALKEALK